MTIRDGVVRGPVIGATIDGQIDYARDETRLHGTFVPLYGLNNMFGRIPIFGMFLGGGSNEGLVGITYEAFGPPAAAHQHQSDLRGRARPAARNSCPRPGMADPGFNPQPR